MSVNSFRQTVVILKQINGFLFLSKIGSICKRERKEEEREMKQGKEEDKASEERKQRPEKGDRVEKRRKRGREKEMERQRKE